MTVYDYREITLKDDLCLEISRDTDIENPRENDCNAATFYCLKSPRRKIGDIIDSAYYLNETKRTLAKTGEYKLLSGMGSILSIMICLIVVITLSPVFSEEYALHTDSIIYSARYGRTKLTTSKIIAALEVVIGTYLLYLLLNLVLYP